MRLAPGTLQSISAIAQLDWKPGDGVPAGAVSGHGLVGVTRNMGADGQTPGKIVRLVDRAMLDASDPSWHTKSASAVRSYTYDPILPSVYSVSPGAAADAPVWVEVKLLANPTRFNPADAGVLTQVLSLDDRYADDVLSYVLARAFMVDAEVAGSAALAAANTNIFVGSINAQAIAMTGVNPNLQHLPINPSIPAASR